MAISNRGFGIEIEFVGARNGQVAQAIRDAGIDCAVESYNHITRDHWKVVTDASLSHRDGCGEVVSPILQGEAGLEALKKVTEALNSVQGLHVNRSCGLHVHLDSRDMTIGEIGRVFERYASFEDSIDNIMPRSRRGNSRWANSITGSVDSIKRAIDTAGNGAIQDGRTTREKRDLAYAIGRYYKINLTNVADRGSIEFRQHSGTTDFTKISKWLTFLMQFVETSIRLQRNGNSAPKQIKARKSVAYDAVRKIADENKVTVEWMRGRGFRWIHRPTDDFAIFNYTEMEAMYDGPNDHNAFSRNKIERKLRELGWMAEAQTTDTGLFDGITQDVQNWMQERDEELN
jgi:hypothetical protein